MLAADPTFRIVKKCSATSLVILSNGKHLVLRNEDIANASLAIQNATTPASLPCTWMGFLQDPHRHRYHPQWSILTPSEFYNVSEHWYWDTTHIPFHPPNTTAESRKPSLPDAQLQPQLLPPLPAWRQAQVDSLANAPPIPPARWTLPTWGSESSSEPSREPDTYLSHRNGRRTATIRALDPDNLLRHEPPPFPNPTVPGGRHSPGDSDIAIHLANLSPPFARPGLNAGTKSLVLHPQARKSTHRLCLRSKAVLPPTPAAPFAIPPSLIPSPLAPSLSASTRIRTLPWITATLLTPFDPSQRPSTPAPAKLATARKV
jgi:hypothetical protein